MTVLVMDVGSSSVRALLLDENAAPVADAMVRAEYRFREDATADALTLRLMIETCIDSILQHRAAAEIRAVGMATFVGNLLGVDAHGEPVTPLYTYADTRSQESVQALAQEIDARASHARTGCPLHAAYHPAKLHWLKQHEPHVFTRARHWLDLATYCYSAWFARDVPCSYSVASWSGLLNRAALAWDAAWLDALGIPVESLPTLADFNTVQRGLAGAYAERWPLLRDIPFYLAVGDGAAANIGSGGVDPQHPVLTVGTTAAIRIVTPAPAEVPFGLWAYRVDAARHLVGGATSEGGNVFAWAQHTLRFDPDTLEELLSRRMPGEHGLTALPLLAGERSPMYHADAVGTLHGLRLETSALDMVHALLEGVALRLRLIYDLLGRPGDSVLASGGALMRSPAWAQIMADVLGVPLHLVDVPEATARGVALLMHGQGSPLPVAQVIAPRAGTQDAVTALLARHQALYHAVVGRGV